jgi:hypothetical protein
VAIPSISLRRETAYSLDLELDFDLDLDLVPYFGSVDLFNLDHCELSTKHSAIPSFCVYVEVEVQDQELHSFATYTD